MLLKRLFELIKILDRVTPGASRSLGWEVLLTALSFPASILLNRTLGAEERGLLASIILVPSTVFAIGSCQWDRLLTGLITSKQISGREAWRRTTYYAYWLSFAFIPIGIISSLAYTKIPLKAQLLGALYSATFPIYFMGLCLAAIFTATGSINGRYTMRMSLNFSYLILIFILLGCGFISITFLVFVYAAIHIISLGVGWVKKEKLLYGVVLPQKPSLIPLIKGFPPYFLETFSGKLDIWAFSFFGTLLTLGYYTGITAMMLPVGLVAQALTVSSTARLDWTQPVLVRRYMHKTVLVFIAVLIGLITGGILIGTDLLTLFLGKSFKDGEWMIPWIASIVVSNSAATQFHSALQLSGLQSAYLLIQTIEPIVRLLIILGLGWWLSELGILLGMVVASTLKAGLCFCVYKTIKFDLQ